MDDGWISWDGGECPVADDAMVNWRIRDRSEDEDTEICRADGLDWTHLGDSHDIIAYRIVSPA